MNNLSSMIGLDDLFRRASVDPSPNFELAYGQLKERPDCAEIAIELEHRVYEYFAGMRLPDEPTLYDLLVLSLRSKDVIATFNWDPLLVEACVRNSEVAPAPRLVFLHGNTGIGVCGECRLVRPAGTVCSRCGAQLGATRILYPVARKDYNSDVFISGEWRTVGRALRQAYMLTIFGYGAPASDVEAIGLLRNAWGPKEQRNLEEVEIIDIKPEDDVTQSWDDFIHTHHYRVEQSFDRSWIHQFPRRSCEAMWSQLMELNWDPPGTPLPGASWGVLRQAVASLVAAERDPT